jgi:predicted O-methyltransferase YrrM
VSETEPVGAAERAQTFDEVLAAVADVGGWMTDDQARRLWDRARAVPPGGQIVEIGSFQGRSMVVLASAAADGVAIVAIDPHGGTDRGPEEIAGYEAEGEEDNRLFHANLRRAGVADRVRHLRAYSDAALADVSGPIDLLYIDGAHRFGPARADIRSWGRRVPEGGTMLIHDCYSSVGVTLAVLVELFLHPRFRYVGRSGTLTEYRRRGDRFGPRGRTKNALRQARELPYFAYNVLLKVMIKVGLGRFTKYLGHPSSDWPY